MLSVVLRLVAQTVAMTSASQLVAAVVTVGAGCAAASGSSGTAVCDIRDHGAVGDGVHLDTRALKACVARGPGVTILVPAAVNNCRYRNLSSCYLTGAINLTSHQTLHIEKGAGLIGSVELDKSASPFNCSHCSWDLEHYPRLPSLPSYDDARYAALVSSYNATGVRIEGEGLLDGARLGTLAGPCAIQSHRSAPTLSLIHI